MNSDLGFRRTEPICSPLDPFLSQFLRSVQQLANGYLPSSDRYALAQALDWPLDFLDAILVSAQARGMIERVHHGNGRRRVIWTVSSRGRIWLDLLLGPATISSPEVMPPTVLPM